MGWLVLIVTAIAIRFLMTLRARVKGSGRPPLWQIVLHAIFLGLMVGFSLFQVNTLLWLISQLFSSEALPRFAEFFEQVVSHPQVFPHFWNFSAWLIGVLLSLFLLVAAWELAAGKEYMRQFFLKSLPFLVVTGWVVWATDFVRGIEAMGREPASILSEPWGMAYFVFTMGFPALFFFLMSRFYQKAHVAQFFQSKR